jgi:hypothetical protein
LFGLISVLTPANDQDSPAWPGAGALARIAGPILRA